MPAITDVQTSVTVQTVEYDSQVLEICKNILVDYPDYHYLLCPYDSDNHYFCLVLADSDVSITKVEQAGTLTSCYFSGDLVVYQIGYNLGGRGRTITKDIELKEYEIGSSVDYHIIDGTYEAYQFPDTRVWYTRVTAPSHFSFANSQYCLVYSDLSRYTMPLIEGGVKYAYTENCLLFFGFVFVLVDRLFRRLF